MDVQNLYYSAKYIYSSKVNYKELLKRVVGPRELIRAIAYVVRAEELKEATFFDALKAIGFEVKSKDLQIFAGGQRKGDWDVGIAMDCIELGPKLDTIVLVSGDGDYQPLVEHLKRAVGCRVEVAAFGRSASGKLKEVADDFIDLDQNSSRYLIKRGEVKPHARKNHREEKAEEASE